MRYLRRFLLPAWRDSSSREQRLLDASFRLSAIALGVVLALGTHGWYRWVPIGTMAVALYAYPAFSRIWKRLRRSSGSNTHDHRQRQTP
jgi:hypothetical protein